MPAAASMALTLLRGVSSMGDLATREAGEEDAEEARERLGVEVADILAEDGCSMLAWTYG